ncbi:MAG: TfoX/Sxy family protein [Acidimicrobiia bacterium]|nr:TfoX/Sxy family protein [Acidimicrobiia bacterium]
MAYDDDLADRLREHLAPLKAVTEREMFGGISFMVGGNMCCGVLGDDLVVRIDPTLHHDALTRPNVSEFSMGGRTSRGMIRVSPAGVADDGELALWVRLGIAHATALPPKKAVAPKKAAPKKKAAPAKKKSAAPARKKTAPAKKKAAAPMKKKAATIKKKAAPAKKKAVPAKKKAAKKAAKKRK